MVHSVPQNHVSIFTVFYVSGIILRKRCIKAWSTWFELRVFCLVWLVPMTSEHIQPWNCLNSDRFLPMTCKPRKSGRGLNGELSGPAVSSDKRPHSVLIFIPEQEECEFMSSEPSHLDAVSAGSVPYSGPAVADDKRSYSALILIPEFEECSFMTSEQSQSGHGLNWQRSFWTGCHPWQSIRPTPDIFPRVWGM